MNNTKIYSALDRKLSEGIAVALLTVVSSEGSTPRESGAKMLVCADGSVEGTVGGGKLELLSIAEAKKALAEGANRKVRFDLTEQGIGMVCSGSAEVFIEIYKQQLRLFIAGCGHVAQKLGAVCAAMELSYDVADDREEFANKDRFPGATNIYVQRPDEAITAKTVNRDTGVVIVTRGHMLDQEALEAALKTDAFYIGMIGSRNKVGVVYSSLKKKNLMNKPEQRVYSPIGLELGGKSPEEISISIMAEIIKVRHGAGGGHMRLS